MSNYEKLALEILNYANGLPLAIKVLGSFLFGRDILEWRSALARLRENPNKDIMDVLQLSFDGLEKMEKEIFLDIACFFNHYGVEYVKNVLNCRGFHPNIGLRVLINKSLIRIWDEGWLAKSSIVMHDLLQELGRKIVQGYSIKEPRKWSRLWLQEYFYNVILENMEKNVEAIVLNHQYQREMETLMAKALPKMSHLRLLILKKVNFPGSLVYLSSELRYVEWDEYPFMYLPSSFQPSQVVELFLKHSSIKQLWEEHKYLPNLRTLDLSHSRNLIKMLDFGEVPNLELLNLEGCVKLMRVDSSIGLLRKLVFLNLKDCKNLISIPNNVFGLSSLKDVNLSGCSKAFNNSRHLKKLDIREIALHSQSMPSILKWIALPSHLHPEAYKDLAVAGCLFPSLPSFSCLRQLDVSFCCVSRIPDAIGFTRCLERLDLRGNNFVTLPSLSKLSKLVYLNLEHCKQLKYLPELPSPIAIEQDHHIFSYPQYWRRVGLYIFDCPELGERECYNSMVLSWMTQFIQANQESSNSFHRLQIVIPGSEIPRWFNNQSMGSSSMSVDLSPIMHDHNFIGVACCAVFSVTPDDPPTAIIGSEPIVELGFKNNNAHHSLFYDIPVNFDRDLITVKSNHMWIFYFTHKSFIEFLSCEDISDIKMKTCVVDGGGLHVEVKNLGYRWIFNQDLQLMHCGNLLAPKRKFLAISDETQPQPQSFI